jgi:hypothetical protein
MNITTYDRCRAAVLRLAIDRPGTSMEMLQKTLPLLPRRELALAIDDLATEGIVAIYQLRGDGIDRIATPNHLPIRRISTREQESLGATPISQLIAALRMIEGKKSAIENQIANDLKRIAKHAARNSVKGNSRVREIQRQIAENERLLARLRREVQELQKQLNSEVNAA